MPQLPLLRQTHAQVRSPGATCDGITTQRRNGHSAALHAPPSFLRTEPRVPVSTGANGFGRSRARNSAGRASKGINSMNTVTNTANTKNLVDTAAANGSFKTFGKAIE